MPVYPTRIPPAFSLRYDMSRGAISGLGTLAWTHEASGYSLRLEGTVPLLGPLLLQHSAGSFDAHGLAPERFTDQRRGRAELAANFMRQAGKITFSGSTVEVPLLPGTQDRVSWMVQLAAIAQADPGRVKVGQKLTLHVVGARGDANAWSFMSSGLQPVRVGGRTLEAVKLVREPRKPHDTLVEVWLDPARHHLPVRARLTEGRGGEALELVLQAGS